jgi:hypothetical protein
MARGGVASRGVDLFEDDARRGEPEAGAAVLLRNQRGEPAVLGERTHELFGVPVGLERAPVLAREAAAELGDRITDLEQLVWRRGLHDAAGHDNREPATILRAQ